MAKRKIKYPGTDYKPPRITKEMLDNEPDILETAGGFCPNYEKYERMGYTAEEALVKCNMD